MRRPEETRTPTLAEIEDEWELLFRRCLEECARGRSGLFANSPVVSAFADWPEAERLRSLARQIRDIYASRGSKHPGCERFLQYCSRSGNNIREDPKLAAEFLKELQADAAANPRHAGTGKRESR